VSKLRNFWSLARREKLLFCEASILLLLSNFCIKAVAFKRIYSFLCDRYGWVRADVGGPSSHASDVKLVKRSILRAANHLPFTSLCLSQSIAQFIMLRHRGIPAVLFAGVKFSDNSLLDAHAWVETDPEKNDESFKNFGFSTVIRIGTRAAIR
jgi:hypothetical protein